MPYYHVRVSKRRGRPRWTFVFDLSRESLEENIVKPLVHWKPFLVGKSPIEPSNIDQIQINETEEPAPKILKRTKLKRNGNKDLRGIGETKSKDYVDEFYVTNTGKDVTHDFVKGFYEVKKPLAHFSKGQAVFIVHGSETKSVDELKEILLELGLEVIVLQKDTSKGKTVMEKLEEYANEVGFVFVILTPDDVGMAAANYRTEKTALKYEIEFDALKSRPRQNVIFEFGYFAGKLGRSKICYMKRGNPELPSDIEGIVYIPFQESVIKNKNKILKELKAAGYEVEKGGDEIG